MRFTKKFAAATVASTALLMVPAVAVASHSHHAKVPKPIANGNYCINCTAHEQPGMFHVATNGKSIDNWTYYNNCVRIPVEKHPAMDISKNGTFYFKGVLKDVSGKKFHFLVKGHFVKSRLIQGVISATGGGKTCKAAPYKAKFQNTGAFQPF